jgi:hypothetical protein
MTALDNAALRRLTLKVLAQYAGEGASAGALGAAVLRAYNDLAAALIPLIGNQGVETLTARALHVTGREYPWLNGAREPGKPTEPAEPVTDAMSRLDRQDPAVASEAAGALLATFTGLLVTFIGESLTTQLLRKAWPDAVPTQAHRRDRQ